MVLVMTVEPGFGGQSINLNCLEKVKKLRDHCLKENISIDIQVDGGVTLENIEACASSGANCFVAGSSVFKAKDPEKVVLKMLEKIKK